MTTNVTRLRQDLEVLIKEYLSINNSARLLRFDFFRQQPDIWHLAILVEQDGRHCLMNARGELLACYDEITPLFCLPQAAKTQAQVEDLQDQLLCLRSKAPQGQVLAMAQDLQTLCCEFRSLSAAYRITEQGQYGILDPWGQVVVEPKYRCIEPFPFREKYGAPGDWGSPAPGGRYGETGLYLCRGDLHRLNATDVYDLKGNLIFQGIAGLYTRQELWVTPERITESAAPQLRQEKQVRSIWVSRQEVRQPFPDAPELQSILDKSCHFSVASLSKSIAENRLRCGKLDNALPWFWDAGSVLADRAAKRNPQPFRALLFPLAEGIGSHIGYSPEAVLDRLGDYSDFHRQRTRIDLEKLTPETPLQTLGLTAQAYNCLVRSGITTVGDLMSRSEERLSQLRLSTPQASQEITELWTRLQKHVKA